MGRVVLTVHAATKRYPGVKALDGVDLEIRAGEVHALVGENGAGKSTLVRVIGGIQPLDSGEVTLDGQPFRPLSPQESLRAGVRVVHQELSTLPNLSVAENLFLDGLPRRSGFVRFSELNARAADVLSRVGLDVDPRTRMEELSLAQTQLVEIARAIASEARLIIFDEPTATLTSPEKKRLLSLVSELRSRGTAIIYISHHFDEIFSVCDRATVLRNGRSIGTYLVDEVSPDDLVRHMVGKEFAEEHPYPDDVIPGGILLDVDSLVVPGASEPVSFQVRAGEILGVSGLVGAGRTEAMRALFGADRALGGEVRIRGERVRITSPRDAIRAGISFATEDRKHQGLVLQMGSDVNVTLASIDRVSRGGFILRRKELADAAAIVKRMAVKVSSVIAPVGSLSGGNQQKIVLGRWIYKDSDVLIVDEPTRGIDIGARHEIYGLLGELARRGKAIVMVSSDLRELTGMCHRMLVFSKGRVVADLDRSEFDDEAILKHAYSAYLEVPAAS